MNELTRIPINIVKSLRPITGIYEVDQLIAEGASLIAEEKRKRDEEQEARNAEFRAEMASRRAMQNAAISRALGKFPFLLEFIEWDDENPDYAFIAIPGVAPLRLSCKAYENYSVKGPFLPCYTIYHYNRLNSAEDVALYGKQHIGCDYEETGWPPSYAVALAQAVDLERERREMEQKVDQHNLDVDLEREREAAAAQEPQAPIPAPRSLAERLVDILREITSAPDWVRPASIDPDADEGQTISRLR